MNNMNEKNLNELEKVSGGRPVFAVQNDAEIHEIVFPVPGPVPPTPDPVPVDEPKMPVISRVIK